MDTIKQIDKAAINYYFSKLQTGIDNRCRERMIQRCLPHITRGSSILELGFMDGQWTDHFLDIGCRVTAVEGATRNVDYGRAKYREEPRVTLVHSTFQDYEPSQRFDVVHMGGMLKHMEDPVALLQRSLAWLNPGGLLIATTPNARSLHRRVGVYMGMLSDLSSLSETDRKIDNLRHYDLDSFRKLLVDGGFSIVDIATAILKPVSSDRMSDWPDDLLDALDRIATDIPDYGWYIYAIARAK